MLSSHRSRHRDKIHQEQLRKIRSLLNEYVSTSLFVCLRMEELTRILLPIVNSIMDGTGKNEGMSLNENEIEMLLCICETYKELQNIPGDIESIIANDQHYNEERNQYTGKYKILNDDGECVYLALEEADENELDLLLRQISRYYDPAQHSSIELTNAKMMANCKWVTLNFDEIRALITKIQESKLSCLSNEDRCTLSIHYSIPMQRLMRIKDLFINLSDASPTNAHARISSKNIQKICSKTNLYATFSSSLNKEELRQYSRPHYLVSTIYWVDMVGRSFKEEYNAFLEECTEQKNKRLTGDNPICLLEKINESINEITRVINKNDITTIDLERVKKHFSQLSVSAPAYFISFNKSLAMAEDKYECIKLARASAYMNERFMKALTENHYPLTTNDINAIAKIVISRLQEKLEKNEKEKENSDGYAERTRLDHQLILANVKAMLRAQNDQPIPRDSAAISMIVELAMNAINQFKMKNTDQTALTPNFFTRYFGNNQDQTRAISFQSLIQKEGDLFRQLIVLHAIFTSNQDKNLQQGIAGEFQRILEEPFTAKEFKSCLMTMIKSIIRSRVGEEANIVREEMNCVNRAANEILRSIKNFRPFNEIDIIKIEEKKLYP